MLKLLGMGYLSGKKYDNATWPVWEELKRTCADNVQDNEKLWMLHLVFHIGLDVEEHLISSFKTREQADQNLEYWLRDATSNDFNKIMFSHFTSHRFKDLYLTSEGRIDGDSSFGVLNAFYQPCCDILQEVDVLSDSLKLSSKCIKWVGKSHIIWMMTTYGEKWAFVAILEYCINNFPQSSLATMASQVLYNFNVKNDKYSAGYLWREMQLIMGGAEETAQKALDGQLSRNDGSSKKNTEAKLERIKDYWQEIRAFSDISDRLDEQIILDQAWENACQKWGKTPVKSTRDIYETYIRSNEPFQSEYYAMMKNA